MRYQLKQIHCRPWTLSGLSLKLIESHYENNYGGALRRLNAITGRINQYASEHSQAIAGGVPLLALDMYEHAYHIDFGANATAFVDTFLRATGGRSRAASTTRAKWRRRGR